MFFHFPELFKELFCEIIIWVMVRTKEGDKAGSNQPPTRDPVHFKLELMPNHWISRVGNTSIGSMRYVSMLLPNLNSILTKSSEESNPGVARAAFSTWFVQTAYFKFHWSRILPWSCWESCMLLQLQDRFSREVDFGRIKLRFGENIKTYLVNPMQVFPIQAAKFNGWHQFQL